MCRMCHHNNRAVLDEQPDMPANRKDVACTCEWVKAKGKEEGKHYWLPLPCERCLRIFYRFSAAEPFVAIDLYGKRHCFMEKKEEKAEKKD